MQCIYSSNIYIYNILTHMFDIYLTVLPCFVGNLLRIFSNWQSNPGSLSVGSGQIHQSIDFSGSNVKGGR